MTKNSGKAIEDAQDFPELPSANSLQPGLPSGKPPGTERPSGFRTNPIVLRSGTVMSGRTQPSRLGTNNTTPKSNLLVTPSTPLCGGILSDSVSLPSSEGRAIILNNSTLSHIPLTIIPGPSSDASAPLDGVNTREVQLWPRLYPRIWELADSCR